MSWPILFILELIVLYIISRNLTRLILRFSERIFHSRQKTMYLFSVLFLPGTMIHELSHLVMAKLLFVPVGEFSLAPHLEESRINLGHVTIAKTDIFRRFLVGIAPFIAGLLIIFILVYLVTTNDLTQNIFVILAVGFLVFEIANTMYSSKRDWEGSWLVLVILLAFVIAFYLIGIPLHEVFFIPEINEVIKMACGFLLIPLTLDLVLVLLLKVL